MQVTLVLTREEAGSVLHSLITSSSQYRSLAERINNQVVEQLFPEEIENSEQPTEARVIKINIDEPNADN